MTDLLLLCKMVATDLYGGAFRWKEVATRVWGSSGRVSLLHDDPEL